jgi:hypothetical protein
MDLIWFVLCAYGLTQLLVFSTLFEKIRPKNYFFHCPMCMGFWVGVLLLCLNPYTELFIFDVSFVNAVVLGSISSGTSYALCVLISDGGFQHEHRTRGNVDTEMDAKARRKVLQG